MEPSKTDIQVHSTLQGEQVDMTLDANSLAHVISLLTDLYSDPELACIREYSTNAWDSHVEANKSSPIEVFTPSPLSQMFKVIDHGVGLNAEDIRTIYSKYGASTKRQTNLLSGVLGLGCKSALTYAAQFTVKGVKDGVRTVMSISRKEDGAGVITILDESQTSEPNGVEIAIPTKRENRFAAKVEAFFRFWPKGSVLVNGKEPERIKGVELSPHIWLAEGLNNHIIVMGNVPYPLDERFNDFEGLQRGKHIVMWVGMGEVDFVPSREALQYTKKTTQKIDSLQEEYKVKLMRSILEDVNKASTHAEALYKTWNWASMLTSRPAVSYRGRPVPYSFSLPREISPMESRTGPISGGNNNLEELIYVPYRETYYKNDQMIREIKTDEPNKKLYVDGFTAQKLTKAHRAKLVKYADDKELVIEAFVLCPRRLAMAQPWVDPKLFVTWEEIRQIKIEGASAAAGGPARLKGSYDIWQRGEQKKETPAEKIDKTHKIIYHERRTRRLNRTSASLLERIYPSCTLVDLTGNRIEKFKRDFPTAISFKTASTEAADLIFNKIPEDDLKARMYHHSRFLSQLDPGKIKDPKLRKAVSLATKATLSPEIDTLVEAQKHLGLWNVSDKLQVEVDNPLEKYPLLGGYEIHPHTYVYINHVYRLRAEGKNI